MVKMWSDPWSEVEVKMETCRSEPEGSERKVILDFFCLVVG